MGVKRASAAKSLLAGFAGGIAGAWAMRRFSAAWRRCGGPSCAPPGEPYSSQEWESAARAAELLTRSVLGRGLSPDEKRRGAAAVHYAIGGLAGAGYALAARPYPALRAASGAGFGFAFWLLGDELAIPRMGLSAPPSRYSLPMQVNSLGEHLVYGLMAEQVRRVLQGC